MAKTALQGSDYILFFRRYRDREKKAASRLFFQTEHSIEKTKDNDTTPTKDGTINNVRDGENTIPITSVAYYDDEGTKTVWEELEEWFDANERVEIWEVNRNKFVTGSNNAKYFQGMFTDFSRSAPSDGVSELDMTFAIEGKGVSGEVELTEEQQEVAQYAFTDLEKVVPEA